MLEAERLLIADCRLQCFCKGQRQCLRELRFPSHNRVPAERSSRTSKWFSSDWEPRAGRPASAPRCGGGPCWTAHSGCCVLCARTRALQGMDCAPHTRCSRSSLGSGSCCYLYRKVGPRGRAIMRSPQCLAVRAAHGESSPCSVLPVAATSLPNRFTACAIPVTIDLPCFHPPIPSCPTCID